MTMLLLLNDLQMFFKHSMRLRTQLSSSPQSTGIDWAGFNVSTNTL